MALAGIGKRRTPKKIFTPLSTKSQKMKRRAQPLFDADSDEDFPMLPVAGDDDPIIQLALQESLESQETADMQHALEASRNEFQKRHPVEAASTVGSSLNLSENLASEVSDGDDLNVPGRLETALAIANAGPTPKSISMTGRLSSSFPEGPVFNAPKLLIDHPSPSPDLSEDAPLEYLDALDEVEQTISPIDGPHTTPKMADVSPGRIPLSMGADESRQAVFVGGQVEDVGDSDEDMEPVLISIPKNKLSSPIASLETPRSKDVLSTPRSATKVHFDDDNLLARRTTITKTPSPQCVVQYPTHEHVLIPDSEKSEEEHVISDWSRSPSPVAEALPATETAASKASTIEDSWDAAQEMDPHAEEGEFARFLSQVKGKDLDVVRHEIDEEIKTLNKQKKAAMRDSEDITQQMIAQIMVRSRDACLLSPEYSLLRR
jgi:DNA excision repair protein ERCC-5